MISGMVYRVNNWTNQIAGFNEETGILPDDDDPGSDEDVEIEMVEEEPAFLRGQTKVSIHHSPVKIVKVRAAGTYMYMYTHAYIHTYTHTHARTHTHTHIHTRAHTHAYVRTHIHAHTHTHTHTHRQTHRHRHTHRHTQTQSH